MSAPRPYAAGGAARSAWSGVAERRPAPAPEPLPPGDRPLAPSHSAQPCPTDGALSDLSLPPPSQADSLRPAEGLLQRLARVVAAIPRGRVATYGQVAAQAGNPRAARQVAWALRAYGGRGLPWHRVIGAGGDIRLPAGNGLERQRALLRAEGVAVDAAGHLDLAAYQWRP